MKKTSIRDRLLLLATSLLAGYQVAVGIDGLTHLAILFYTLAFGALMVAALMMIILGQEALGRSSVMLLSTLLPVCLALGIITDKLPEASFPALMIAGVGFVLLVAARQFISPSAARIALVGLHGVSGFIIVGFPVVSVISGSAPLAFGLVGIGGAAISLTGSFIAFQKQSFDSTIELLSQQLPWLLLIITICFTAGMAWGTA